MAEKFERRSLQLTEQEWLSLEIMAAELKTLAPKGSNYGKPSWRSLFKQIAQGKLIVTKR
jgi:hypothetical protein